MRCSWNRLIESFLTTCRKAFALSSACITRERRDCMCDDGLVAFYKLIIINNIIKERERERRLLHFDPNALAQQQSQID